jgi:hypothetical protein
MRSLTEVSSKFLEKKARISMPTALDADPLQFDKHEQNFIEQIRKHGWFGMHVFASDDEAPGFSYTTGFWLKFEFPEVIVFSLRRQVAHDTFWHICHELEAGRRLPIGEPTEAIFKNFPAVLLPISPHQYRSHLGWSRWFYGSDDFLCLQLVFPDTSGHFPWSSRSESF